MLLFVGVEPTLKIKILANFIENAVKIVYKIQF